MAREQKSEFLLRNEMLNEIEFDEGGTVGGFESIDEFEDEVWLMQCPKGFIMQPLTDKKLKMPGRTKMDTIETIAIQSDAEQKEAFGYVNQKGRYCVKLLPVTGKIVLHHRLEAVPTITDDVFGAEPKAGRVDLPSRITVRHPLLGYRFDKHIKAASQASERLKEAERMSQEAGVKSLARSTSKKSKRAVKPIEQAIKEEIQIIENSSDEEKLKKKSKKRKSMTENAKDASNLKKAKKTRKVFEDDVAEDLQWLQKL